MDSQSTRASAQPEIRARRRVLGQARPPGPGAVRRLSAAAPNAKPLSATAEQILDVAETLIQTRSYSAFSYQDIADALGVSLGKVKTDIHRGREALRRLLSSDAAF